MLASLKLTNFKAFDYLSLDVRPITLLLGPNNSGKSSIISSLRLMVQTVESYDARIPLLLNGIMGDFGTYRDLVYLNHGARKIGINLVFRGSNVVAEENVDRASSELDLSYKYRSGRREVVLSECTVKRNGENLISVGFSKDADRVLIQKIGHRIVPNALKSPISATLRFQNFMPLFGGMFALRNSGDSAAESFVTPGALDTLRRASRVATVVSNSLRTTEYIGAMRVPPSRTYLYTGERRSRVGASGEYAANILALDAARGGSKSRELTRSVNTWLSQAGMASALNIASISDRHYELRVQHPISKETQNFADIGFGHSQVLPVLVGGYNLQPGATYLVEQPEIHLHPRAQAELGDFFLDLNRRRIQSIIETHSEHLILRLQQHVARGLIAPDDICFYYVHATEEHKHVTRLELDEKGQFVSEWPEGFFPERLNEAKALAKIRYEKQVEAAL